MPQKIDFKYAGIIVGVVMTSCFIHEFGHFITGVLLGNKMKMTLNMTAPLHEYLHAWHAPVVSSAGPLFTLLQAIVAFVLIQYDFSNRTLFVFLLTPVTLRIWSYLVSPFRAQDEAIVGQACGLAPWIFPLVVWLILGGLAWWGSRKIQVSSKFVWITILLILIAFQVVLRANNLVVSLLT